MKKPHFESVLEMFPTLKGQRYKDAPRLVQETGILYRLQMLRKHFNKSRVITNDGKYEYTPQVFAYWYMFEAEQCPIFKMAREFSEELAKVDLDVKTSMIPVSEKLMCIEFPEHMRFDLGGERYARCVYAWVTDERSSTEDGILAKRYFEMFFPLYDKDDNLTQETHQFGLPITDLFSTFSVMLENCRERELQSPHVQELLRQNPFHKVHFNKELFSFVLKCYLYIHSGDPDLREYRAPKPPATRDAKKQRIWFRHHENKSLVDMTLVGFNFKKPVTYSVDSATVIGHFRWQPWGPAREKVKLIWIEAHTRHYKKEGADVQNQG